LIFTFFERKPVPSQKEIRWSQLRVGILVSVAVAALIVLIFLMTGSTGGIFTHKIKLRSYFANAAGLRDGAPVTLQGVTLGNVTRVRVLHGHNPNSVEVTMMVSDSDAALLHTDTTAAIAQAGVLGDSYVDLDSSAAKGPPPGDNAELPSTGAPSIQDVIRTSEYSIEGITRLMGKIEILVDSLNAGKGTIGRLINDPALYEKINHITTDLEAISNATASGKGSLGKFVNDDALYNKANSAVDHLNNITATIDSGKGSAGKLVHDDALYNNLNAAVANTNQLLAQINSGKGAMGKFANDPAFAQRLDDTIAQLDAILKDVKEGKGSLGQLVTNRSLYDHTDQAMDQAGQLLNGMRTNPKKYLVIHFKLF
jgi:phospholipid/cholesterol/gamma-HCH transport system substrate-binding protein